VLLRTTGVDGRLSRPLHGNANLDPPAIELAQRLGCDRVDLGPTAADAKRRLGARPVPTAYLVDTRRWILRPIVWLIDARFALWVAAAQPALGIYLMLVTALRRPAQLGPSSSLFNVRLGYRGGLELHQPGAGILPAQHRPRARGQVLWFEVAGADPALPTGRREDVHRVRADSSIGMV